jgi:hypothetical protein
VATVAARNSASSQAAHRIELDELDEAILADDDRG